MYSFIRAAFFSTLVGFSLLLVSCGSDPSDPNNNPGERLSGVLSGDIVLVDEYGDRLTDHSGVTISVEGTPYSTTTNSQGYWKFDALPSGIYIIHYTKDGFAERRQTGFQFVGGGHLHIEEFPMYRYPTYTISDFRMYVADTTHTQYTLRIGDTLQTDTGKVVVRERDTVVTRVETKGKRMVMTGTLNPAPPNGLSPGIAIVVGTNQQVSKEPGMYKTIIPISANVTNSQFYWAYPLNILTERYPLSAGEHIYAIAYPAVPEYYIYGDAEQRIEIPAFVGPNPSNVADVVLP